MCIPGLIKIRVLGPLHVIRRDGSVVAPDEWRTGKTRDLLRLLALADGRPVRASLLLETLWPRVIDERRRNSLRTATSQIRHTMQTDCVHRQADGLALQDAWVDAVQFRRDAREVHEAVREGLHERVVELALRAESVYRADFQAYDDDAPWAVGERLALRRARQEMLCDAAASALTLGRARESLALASSAVDLDRTSETAHRALMRAHAGLGDVGSALRAFESYRARLAEELGADPSPETRELHLQLLRKLEP